MKKYITILFIYVVSLAAAFPMRAVTADVNAFLLGYGRGEITSSYGNENLKQAGAAIELPQQVIKNYTGNQITAIRFYLAESEQIDSIKVFITKELNGTPLYIYKTSDFHPSSWNQTELETPFEITGESLFVGYYIWAKGRPMGMRDTEGDKSLGNWYSNNGRWTHLSVSGQKVFALEAVLKGDNLPAYDIQIKKIPLPLYVQADKEFALKGTLINRGVKTVTDLEITCTAGENTQTYICSGLDIPYNEEKSFEIPDFTLPAGEYNAVLEITKINGNPDLNPADNQTSSFVKCYQEFYPRKVLLENTTSEYCTNCAEGHRELEQACEKFDNLVRVEHHAGFIEDKFGLQQSWDVYDFYSPAYKFAPGMMIDRTNLEPYGARTVHSQQEAILVGISSVSDVQKWLTACSQIPAYVRINLTTEYNEDENSVNIYVAGDELLKLSAPTAYLNVYIIEDSVFTDSQSNAGKEYYHRHMIRQFVTPSFGEEISMPFDKTYSITLAEEWNKKKLTIVAFVSNYDENHVNSSVVYNADSTPLVKPAPVKTNMTKEVRISQPDKNSLSIEGEFTRAEAYTLEGTLLGSFRNGKLTLKEGYRLLLVKVQQPKEVKTYKVMIRP